MVSTTKELIYIDLFNLEMLGVPAQIGNIIQPNLPHDYMKKVNVTDRGWPFSIAPPLPFLQEQQAFTVVDEALNQKFKEEGKQLAELKTLYMEPERFKVVAPNCHAFIRNTPLHESLFEERPYNYFNIVLNVLSSLAIIITTYYVCEASIRQKNVIQ